MAYLEETATWEPSIYCIERSDPTLGGEYGIFNVPYKQLANRTQHLLAYFLSCHEADGSHKLSEASIASNAKIPEQCFAFPTTTTALHTAYQTHKDTFAALKADIAELSLMEGTSARNLYDAVRLYWKYGVTGFGVCLFTDDFSFNKSIISVNVVTPGIISGDDSIDVDYPEKLQENTTYYLTSPDLTDDIYVTVKSILADHRVLLSEAMTFTSTSAKICNCSWTINNGQAVAAKNQIYITNILDILKEYGSGVLEIGHDNQLATFTVEYKVIEPEDIDRTADTYDASDYTWKEATYIGVSQTDSTFVSSYGLPGGEMQIRIKYTGDPTINVYNLVIYATDASNSNRFVRKPTVTGALKVERFGALYQDTFSSLDILIGTTDFVVGYNEYGQEVIPTGVSKVTLTDVAVSGDYPTVDVYSSVSSKITLTSGTKYYWKARYNSARGYRSAWSNTESFTAA